MIPLRFEVNGLANEVINFFVTADSGLTIVRRLSGKKSQQQSEFVDNQLEQYYSDNLPSVTSGFCSFLENRSTMQPTSLNDNLESLDLTTENLPAVDTPDACDKAALRYVSFVMMFVALKISTKSRSRGDYRKSVKEASEIP